MSHTYTNRHGIGYSDTPTIPGSKWLVHDGTRPEPPVVAPGTFSTKDEPRISPSDAVVLFNGSDLSNWSSMSGGDPKWELVEPAGMRVVPGTGNIRTREEFGSCQLHVEWSAPSTVKGQSQGRGNSGVFLLGLYEVQVLDNFRNPTYADGLAGAIYGQYPPLVNACVEPGCWQVYDIVFESPAFEDRVLEKPAYMTVFHNGLLLHLRQPLQGPTKHRELADYARPHGPKGPLILQDHGDLVRFRNIWIRELPHLQAV